MFMAMISPGMVVNKEYSCAYVGTICTRFDLVLLLGWISSVCLSVTECCTANLCSGKGFYIGALCVSYSCTGGTTAGSYGSREFSLVVRP